jgi:hypothetical protein
MRHVLLGGEVHINICWGNLRERATWKTRRSMGSNIKIDVEETRCVGMEWVILAQDRDR